MRKTLYLQAGWVYCNALRWANVLLWLDPSDLVVALEVLWEDDALDDPAYAVAEALQEACERLVGRPRLPAEGAPLLGKHRRVVPGRGGRRRWHCGILWFNFLTKKNESPTVE